MKIAEQVKKIIERERPSAFTLYGGYGTWVGGTKVEFPGGSIRNEKKNKTGRTTYSECHYKDGSYIVYRWSENNGYTLQVFG
jgi:hypothetical protein